jgi:hypothetical protein
MAGQEDLHLALSKVGYAPPTPRKPGLGASIHVHAAPTRSSSSQFAPPQREAAL